MSAPNQEPDFFSPQIARARRFCVELAPPLGRRLAVICGGVEHCTADFEIHRPDFPYWSLEFVAQGLGTLALGGRSYRLVPGTVFSYGPGVPQDIVTDRQRRLVKYFVDFAGFGARRLVCRIGGVPGAVVRASAPAEVLGAFDELIRVGLAVSPRRERLLALQLELLAVRIEESAVPYVEADTRAFATYRRCREHLETHWCRLATAGAAAAECGVDPAYLTRLFKRFDRTTPYRFLMRVKMEHAAERLLDPGALVREVADGLGFSDPYHFSRAFKRVMAVSPGQFARFHRR